MKRVLGLFMCIVGLSVLFGEINADASDKGRAISSRMYSERNIVRDLGGTPIRPIKEFRSNFLPKMEKEINLVNGGFEEPKIELDNYKFFDASMVPGWETTASDNKIEIQSNKFLNIYADTGEQWAEINANQFGALYQDVETVPGMLVYWEVAHRGREGIDKAIVEFGDPKATELEEIKIMETGKQWRLYKGSYRVPEGQTKTRFQFRSLATSTGKPTYGNFIDSIKFTSEFIRTFITVKYVDELGNAIALPDEIEGAEGLPYETTAKVINGWALKEIPTNANGVFSDKDQTVTYVYKRSTTHPLVEGNVVSRYVDSTGKVIAQSVEISGKVGETYQTTAKEIPGYRLSGEPNNKTGIFSEGILYVTYVYDKISGVSPSVEGSVISRYTDITGKPIASSSEQTGYVGTNYETQVKTIPGYELTELPTNANGMYQEGEVIVTYIYIKKESETPQIEGHVISHYVDTSGKAIASSSDQTGSLGFKYRTFAKDIPGYELIEIPDNAQGIFSEGQIQVTYIYRKISDITTIVEGNVISRYVDEFGKTLTQSNEVSGRVGTGYDTFAKTITGYELLGEPYNKSGVFEEGIVYVTYIYKKVGATDPVIVEGNVISRYIDTEGNPVASSSEQSGPVGKRYTTIAKEIPGYELTGEPSNQNGVYSEGQTIVTYVYQKMTLEPQIVEGHVLTRYIDDKGQVIASSSDQVGEVGTNYHTFEKDIPGYELIGYPENQHGVFREGQTTVIYVYRQEASVPVEIEGQVTSYYVNESRKSIAEPETSIGLVGSNYGTYAKSIPGYRLIEKPEQASGIYKEGHIRVYYVYEKLPDEEEIIEGSVVSRYVDKAGKVIALSNESSGVVGESYVTIEKNIPGYRLTNKPDNATGVFVAGKQEVIYIYEKLDELPVSIEGIVYTTYVNEDGQEIAKSNEQTGIVNEAYQTNSKDIPGYKLIAFPVNKEGYFTEGEIRVVYVYQKLNKEPVLIEGTVKVEYVDVSGNPIANEEQLSGEVGQSYLTSAKTIPGYVLSVEPINGHGLYREGQIIVTYVYEKVSEQPPIVEGYVQSRYIDEEGYSIGTSIEMSGEVGTEYQTNKKDIYGYELLEVPDNEIGVYIEGVVTVTYVYKKTQGEPEIIEGSLVTHYVDETGKRLALSDRMTGIIGEMYETKVKVIFGYELVSTPVNANGQYEEGEIEVTYVYKKLKDKPLLIEGELITKFVDLQGRVLSKEGKETGEVGSKYRTTPKDISGYKLIDIAGDETGVFTEGSKEVTYIYERIVAPVMEYPSTPLEFVPVASKPLVPNVPAKEYPNQRHEIKTFEKRLPKTGEKHSAWLVIGTGMSLVFLVLTLFLSKTRRGTSSFKK